MFGRDAALARNHFRLPPTAKPNPDEAASAARFRAICDELGALRRPLIAVLVHNVGASTWAERDGHRRTDGMGLFRHALDQLAAIYARRMAA